MAEQFALAEAAMSVWSMDDCVDEPTTSVQGENTTRTQTRHPFIANNGLNKVFLQQNVSPAREFRIAALCYQCCVFAMMQKCMLAHNSKQLIL